MKRQIFVSALTAMLFGLTITALLNGAITPVFAQPSLMLRLQPDFVFPKELGEEFDINVTIQGVDASSHLIGIHFRINYNSTLLKVVSVSEGDFLPRFPQTPTPPATILMWATEPDGIFGSHVVVGDLLLPNSTGQWPGPFPEGNGTVATIRFKVNYRPVEPNPVETNILRFIEVILLDDLGQEITPYVTGISLYQSPVPMLYPIPSFTYSPTTPTVGQVVRFLNTSRDPDGTVVSLIWEFGDGATLSTNQTAVTHTYTQPDVYNVTLKAIDNHGLMKSKTVQIKVGVYTPIEIEIEAGEVYYPGEIAEFYILTSRIGMVLDVTFTRLSLYFNSSLFADLSGTTEKIATGLYRIPYTIPGDAEAGVYTLLVEAQYTNITSTTIASFQISSFLSGMISRIDGNVAEILTEVGQLKFDLAAINATLVGIEGTVALIDTQLGVLTTNVTTIYATLVGLQGTVALVDSKLGLLTTDVASIKLNVTEINGDIATIQTTLGSIQGRITTIEDDVATILTDLGEVKADVSGVGGNVGTSTNILYGTLVLALIAAIGAILTMIQMRRK